MPASTEDFKRVMKKIEDLGGDYSKSTERAVNHVWRKLAKSPPKAQGAFSAMASAAQKRAYWAKVTSGEITHGEHGYQRTGTLNKRWLTRVTNGGRTGILLNRTPYGVFVQGDRQQNYHAASKWLTTTEVLDNERDEILEIYRDQVRNIMKGRKA